MDLFDSYGKIKTIFIMRTIFLTLILLSHHSGLISQNPITALNSGPLNSIYFNVLGDAALFSINYDRLFLVNPTFAISGKLGMGVNVDLNLCFWADCDPPNTYAIIPHHVTGNYRIVKNHFVEAGLGGSFIMKIRINPIFYTQLSGTGIFHQRLI